MLASRQRSLHVTLALLVVLGFAFPARGQSSQDVETWLRSELAPKEWTFGDSPVRIEYRELRGSMLSTEELAALGREIEGKPDHPRRAEYERELGRRDHGPDVRAVKFWFAPGIGWRESKSMTSGGQDTYLDTASTDEYTWIMSPKVMSAVDTKGARPKGRNYESAIDTVVIEAGLFTDRGLSYLRSGAAKFERATGDASSWKAVARFDRTNIEIEIVGAMSNGRFVINAIRPVAPNPEYADAGGYRFGGEVEIVKGIVGSPLIEALDASGKVLRTLEWVDRAGVSEDDVRRVLAVPRFDGEDPVRGKATYEKEDDFRASEQRQTVRTGPGQIVEKPLSSGAESGMRLRFAGWVLLGALVILLLILRRRVSASVP